MALQNYKGLHSCDLGGGESTQNCLLSSTSLMWRHHRWFSSSEVSTYLPPPLLWKLSKLTHASWVQALFKSRAQETWFYFTFSNLLRRRKKNQKKCCQLELFKCDCLGRRHPSFVAGILRDSTAQRLWARSPAITSTTLSVKWGCLSKQWHLKFSRSKNKTREEDEP